MYGTQTIGGQVNSLQRGVINFRSQGGVIKILLQGGVGGGRWTKILVLFHSKARVARRKFCPCVENCYFHDFKSILAREARPKIFLTLEWVESYYITIDQSEIFRGGHKLVSEGGGS